MKAKLVKEFYSPDTKVSSMEDLINEIESSSKYARYARFKSIIMGVFIQIADVIGKDQNEVRCEVTNETLTGEELWSTHNQRYFVTVSKCDGKICMSFGYDASYAKKLYGNVIIPDINVKFW